MLVLEFCFISQNLSAVKQTFFFSLPAGYYFNFHQEFHFQFPTHAHTHPNVQPGKPMVPFLYLLLILLRITTTSSVLPSDLTVIAEELRATENLITEYKNKLAILRQLYNNIQTSTTKGSTDTEQDTTVVNNIVARINEQKRSSYTCGAEKRSSSDSPTDSATKYLAKKNIKNFTGPVTTLQVLGIPQRSGGQTYRARAHMAVSSYDIVALTHTDASTKEQYLSMYNKAGDKLFSHPLNQHKAIVQHVATSLNARDPFVATGDEDGIVQLHNSTLYQLGRYLAGRMTPQRNLETGRIMLPDSKEWSKKGVQIKLSFENQIFQTPGKSPIVAIGIKRARYGDMIVVADASGHVHMLLRNGTVAYHIFFEPTHRIGAILPGRRAEPVTLAVGSNLRFVLPPNIDPLPYQCEGTTDQITSIAKDCMRSQFLFAGTTGGDILVFDTTGTTYRAGRSRRPTPSVGARRGGFSRCTLMYKLPCSEKGTRPSNVQVFTVQGAVIAVSASGTSVAYNTTEIWKKPPSVLWRGTHTTMTDDSSTVLAGITVVDGAMPLSNGATMVILTQPRNKKGRAQGMVALTTHRMLLPYYQPVVSDTFNLITTLRGPLVVFLLGGMFVYQLYKRNNKNPPSMTSMFGPGGSGFPSGGGGGGMSGSGRRGPMGGVGDGGRGMDPSNMAGLMEMLKSGGTGGMELASELRRHEMSRR